MSMKQKEFTKRTGVKQVEEGLLLSPKFDKDGLIPAITSDDETGEVLMHGYMNKEALVKTIETGEAYYWSRSRQILWHKGATSGFTQTIKQMLIDDDQDAIWLRVQVSGGASCHVGYRSCFYRNIPVGTETFPPQLEQDNTTKIFDPKVVYAGKDNPTKL